MQPKCDARRRSVNRGMVISSVFSIHLPPRIISPSNQQITKPIMSPSKTKENKNEEKKKKKTGKNVTHIRPRYRLLKYVNSIS